MGREDIAPEFDQIAGNAMVDRDFVPLGFCAAYFETDGTVTVHAYYGDWLKIFPKDILRSMHEFLEGLRRVEAFTEAYAIADETIDGTVKLLEWIGAEYTGKDMTEGKVRGPIYRLEIDKIRI